jgi:DNA-binding MarR family transcriptional regulator
MPHPLTPARIQRLFVGRLLLTRVTGALEEAHDRVLAPLGLTTRQGALLLSCELGEARTPAELARLYGLEASSITRMIERLERKGLLTRAHSRDDRRRVLLRVTPRGRRCLQEALPIAASVAARAWRGITTAERRTLQRVVAQVLRNLDDPMDSQEKSAPHRKTR